MKKEIYLVESLRYGGKVSLTAFDLTTYDDGEERKGPARDVQSTDADVVAFIGSFNADAVADAAAKAVTITEQTTTIAARDETIADLTRQLADMTTARDGLQDDYDRASNAVDAASATIQEQHDEIQTLTTAATDKDAQIADLQAQVEALTPPAPEPRHLAPNDFLHLFTTSELLAMAQATTPAAVLSRLELFTRRYIDLDDSLLTTMVGGLVTAGLLTSDRAARVLAGEAP